MKITFEDLQKELTGLKSKGQDTSFDTIIDHFSEVEKKYQKKEKEENTEMVKSFAKEKAEREKQYNQ